MNVVLNILAFGKPTFEIDMLAKHWPLSAARKTRAWRALFDAAKMEEIVLYAGEKRRERIDPGIFAGNSYDLVPDKNNSIEPAIDGYSDEAFAEIFRGGKRPQIHCVHVGKASFAAWLREQLKVAKAHTKPLMTEVELTKWIKAKECELGGRPRIRAWEDNKEFFQDRGIKKQHFERIWHELYPMANPGRPLKNAP
ncbi:hypothetical protein [Methylocystis sp.]|uniref:hypothetical protein n=1 Tax=Methylocystis sp. TaxID=1911079 RepID=UPI003D0E9AE2